MSYSSCLVSLSYWSVSPDGLIGDYRMVRNTKPDGPSCVFTAENPDYGKSKLVPVPVKKGIVYMFTIIMFTNWCFYLNYIFIYLIFSNFNLFNFNFLHERIFIEISLLIIISSADGLISFRHHLKTHLRFRLSSIMPQRIHAPVNRYDNSP